VAEDLAQGHTDQPEEGTRELTPGWRRDPYGRFAYRWWDGAWTAYVHDGRTTSWDSTPIADTVQRPPGLPGVGTAIAGFVLGVGLSWLVQRLLPDDVSRPLELLLSSLALWVGLVGAVVVVSTTRGTGSIVRDFSFRFRWIDLGFGLAAAFVARLLAAYAVTPIPMPHQRIRSADRNIVGQHTPSTIGWVVLALVVCVGAPFIEELFFRGLVQSRLVDRWGTVPGIGVASLLFGAAHLIAWDGPLSLAFAWAIASSGVILGVAYWSSVRLGTSICTHALFNAQALLVIALLR
jgi:membrane protease YdiL (CAAX protease family)